MDENQSVSFSQVLDAAGIAEPDAYRLEIVDIDRFKRRIVIEHLPSGKRTTKVVHLQKLDRPIMNIAADLTKALAATIPEEDQSSRNNQQPRNGQDFFELAKENEWRIIREFQDQKTGKQWVVYEVPNPNMPQRDNVKPEPDYWVTGDELDWQPGYQFNGSRWLFQRIKLDDDERMVIQKAVHEDIKENKFEFTGSKNPFVDLKELRPDPDYDSTWRLYQSMDGKIKHWIDILKQPAYDRYYFKGEPLYFVAERVIADKGAERKFQA